MSRDCDRSIGCANDKGTSGKVVGINRIDWKSLKYVVLKLKLLESVKKNINIYNLMRYQQKM
jgi:hypothetical protein